MNKIKIFKGNNYTDVEKFVNNWLKVHNTWTCPAPYTIHNIKYCLVASEGDVMHSVLIYYYKNVPLRKYQKENKDE